MPSSLVLLFSSIWQFERIVPMVIWLCLFLYAVFNKIRIDLLSIIFSIPLLQQLLSIAVISETIGLVPFVNIFSFIMFCSIIKNNIITNNQLFLLKIVYYFTILFFMINILLCIKSPDGIDWIYRYRESIGMINPDIPIHLYGNPNVIIRIVFPGMCSATILDRIENNKLYPRTALFFLGFIYMSLRVYIMLTTMMGLLFLIVWITFEKRIKKIGCKKIYILFIVCIIWFECFIVLGNNSFSLLNILAKSFGKDITFSGRTLLWKNAIKIVKDNFFFGRGYQEGRIKTIEIGQSAGAHNYIMDLMYERGLMGVLTIFFIIFMSVIVLKKRIKISGDTYILMGYLLALYIMSLFELFIYSEMLFLPIIYSFIICVRRDSALNI